MHGLARRAALARRETGHGMELEARERECSVAVFVATSNGVDLAWVAQARAHAQWVERFVPPMR